MKVWVLEQFISDQYCYMFEKLFNDLDNAIEYVENKFPCKHGYITEFLSPDDVGIYWAEYYIPKNERKRYDYPEFQLTRVEVE
jgi:hypothetical protein